MDKKEVGARIKSYMKENKITQTEIAAKMGVTQSYISGMINGGKDTLRLAESLSENYGVSLDWLISGNNKSDNITTSTAEDDTKSNERNHYLERVMQLFHEYMENEREYQKIIQKNQEIMKQINAVYQLMKKG